MNAKRTVLAACLVAMRRLTPFIIEFQANVFRPGLCNGGQIAGMREFSPCNFGQMTGMRIQTPGNCDRKAVVRGKMTDVRQFSIHIF